MKNTKRLLLTTVFAVALLSLFISASQVPAVQAAEMTVPEKSLLILDEVAGFNMTAYTPFLQSDQNRQFLGSTQEEVDFALVSKEGKLRIKCSFIGDHLCQIFVTDPSGVLSLNQPFVDALASAKGFLDRYQSYTSDSFYGDLRSMLDAVNVGENLTKTEGNVQLKVSVAGQTLADFMWTYVDDSGVPAVAKNMVLNYRDGVLKTFLDNWQLYTIAAEPVLSGEEAVGIGLDAVEDYSWTVENTERGTVTVSDFNIVEVGNASLCYLNYRDASSARGGDPFILYPSWYIPLGFDKVYPGGVTGVTVRVWADNADVSGIGPMLGGVVPSPAVSYSDVQEQAVVLTVPIALVVAACVASFYFGDSKNRFRRLKGMQKWSLKLSAVLLCLTVSFNMVFMTVLKVQAIPYSDAKSMIYASTYEQIQQEIDAASDVCDIIEGYFNNKGFNTTNAFGTNTTKQYLIDTIPIVEQNHIVTTFYFGHMYGPNHYWDSNGNDISYSDIENVTTGQNYFAWSWVCESIQNWPSCSGLPEAWTQDDSMSSNGYLNPDSGYHSYIGFYDASATLTNSSFQNHAGKLGKDFITLFYYYALNERYSINDALDLASSSLFSTSYYGSPLYQGFYTWWPVDFGEGMGPDWYPGHMFVYGNGNIHVAMTASIVVSAWAWTGAWWEMIDMDVYVDDLYAGHTAYGWMPVYVSPEENHTIEVDDWCQFGDFGAYFIEGDYYYDNPITVYAGSIGSELNVAALYS